MTEAGMFPNTRAPAVSIVATELLPRKRMLPDESARGAVSEMRSATALVELSSRSVPPPMVMVVFKALPHSARAKVPPVIVVEPV